MNILLYEQVIIDNLYEFWRFVGIKSGTLLTTFNYQAIILQDSDWPKRIFGLNSPELMSEVEFKRLSERIRAGDLPGLITLSESVSEKYRF
ncbi:hypothetical protein C3K47_18740 [Solitalea longa]|uniref:Uncharacterized protein n=1 Tax=Solitalea longa TaxID=2079460 RepID=A0A2S4ZXW8_9SPHI|nr:hypothetical protein [Solitalea longa]POY34772.1 hypothetical protein C3K47_18740 [Solitalea longa]